MKYLSGVVRKSPEPPKCHFTWAVNNIVSGLQHDLGIVVITTIFRITSESVPMHSSVHISVSTRKAFFVEGLTFLARLEALWGWGGVSCLLFSDNTLIVFRAIVQIHIL